LASAKGGDDLSLPSEGAVTPVFALYMHREEHYDSNVTACKCSFFPQVLLFISPVLVFFLRKLSCGASGQFFKQKTLRMQNVHMSNTTHQHVV